LVMDSLEIGPLDRERWEPLLATVDLGPHPPERLGDAIHWSPSDALVAVERPGSPGLAREPARQDAQQRSRVSDVDCGPRLGRTPQADAPQRQVDAAVDRLLALDLGAQHDRCG